MSNIKLETLFKTDPTPLSAPSVRRGYGAVVWTPKEQQRCATLAATQYTVGERCPLDPKSGRFWDTRCWLWEGPVLEDSRGHVHHCPLPIPDSISDLPGLVLDARRLLYCLDKHPPPKPLFLRPRCGQPRCINPDHMQPPAPPSLARRLTAHARLEDRLAAVYEAFYLDGVRPLAAVAALVGLCLTTTYHTVIGRTHADALRRFKEEHGLNGHTLGPKPEPDASTLGTPPRAPATATPNPGRTYKATPKARRTRLKSNRYTDIQICQVLQARGLLPCGPDDHLPVGDRNKDVQEWQSINLDVAQRMNRAGELIRKPLEPRLTYREIEEEIGVRTVMAQRIATGRSFASWPRFEDMGSDAAVRFSPISSHDWQVLALWLKEMDELRVQRSDNPPPFVTLGRPEAPCMHGDKPCWLVGQAVASHAYMRIKLGEAGRGQWWRVPCWAVRECLLQMFNTGQLNPDRRPLARCFQSHCIAPAHAALTTTTAIRMGYLLYSEDRELLAAFSAKTQEYFERIVRRLKERLKTTPEEQWWQIFTKPSEDDPMDWKRLWMKEIYVPTGSRLGLHNQKESIVARRASLEREGRAGGEEYVFLSMELERLKDGGPVDFYSRFAHRVLQTWPEFNPY